MEKYFQLKEKGTTVSKEIVAGITTFLAMAYILAVNPGMLGSIPGMSFGGVFTATAIASAIATLLMAFLANLPVALAPGMGLNAFFTYTVCFGMGCSPWLALTAVLLEGLLFIVLSFFGVREAIIKSIPASMKKAVAVGIGLFICLIGLSNAGIAASDTGTIIGFNNFNLEHSAAIVAILGLVITIVLYVLKVPGAILIGIAITTIIGIPFGVTSIPEGWKPFSLPEKPFLFKFEWGGVLSVKFFVIFFTFLFTDIFDTIGTLVGVTEQGGLVDEEGNIPKVKGALLADAIGTVAGACLGTSTVTSFVESTSGVEAGGRSGLTACVTGVLFFLSILCYPLLSMVTSAVTAPALIVVGILMAQQLGGIDWDDFAFAAAGFMTVIMMVLCYSISNGIALGFITYAIAMVGTGRAKEVKPIIWVLVAIFVIYFATAL